MADSGYQRRREMRARPGSSIWDRSPRWLRVVILVVGFLWFVPPMVLVAVKAVMQ